MEQILQYLEYVGSIFRTMRDSSHAQSELCSGLLWTRFAPFFSAALTQATGVTVAANGWDTRIDGWGCPPTGCVAENVLDASIEPDSRWACRPSRSEIEVCELTFTFDVPQDIFEIRMSMFKGNERNRTVNVLVDGVLSTTIVTSASTLELEAYALSAPQASTIVLQEAGAEENVWLSITEVMDIYSRTQQ